jgi:HAD superfamily hydrolase (TIGR01484 family)
VALRCVYTDLDGTLLGRGGSLFRDGDGAFTLLPGRALEACHRAGAEVVIMSGRRKAQVMEDARLMGQSSYIYELGGGLVIDGEETFLTYPFEPSEGSSVHDQIEATGAPALLLERFELEHHDPFHKDRQVTHLFRGQVDVGEANALLESEGHHELGLVDNGGQAYHLVPAQTSKADAVAAHMRARGYAREECIGVGDSPEDLDVARVVGRFFLVANAAVAVADGAEITEAGYGEGFYEAVVRSLAEA